MDYSVTFARHFSRLVWLLLHEPGSINEQKAALRALVTISKEGPVTMLSRDGRLIVNDVPLAEALTGVQDLAAQIAAHAIQEVVVEQSAAPADLLGVARILAGEPLPGDGGVAIDEKMKALGARTVIVRTVGMLGVNLDGMELDDASLSASHDALPVIDDAPLDPEELARYVSDDMIASTTPTAAAPAPAPVAAPMASAGAAPVIERPTGAAPVPPVQTVDVQTRSIQTSERERVAGAVEAAFQSGSGGGSYLQFAAVPNPKGSAADLIAQLDAARSATVVNRLLDELVTMAENAQREGRYETVTEVFHGIVQREAATPELDLKRAYVMAVRRMAKPTLLRAVSLMLPRRKDSQEACMAVLMRTGEDGADALIEQLTNAQSLSERRIYFDALVQLNSGVPALIHMLGDARWYVARNAADLLGEMQAPEGETPLVEALKHDDDRVRRAATAALAKLGTPKALVALHSALKDSSPEVRKQAAAGLSLRRGQKSAATLNRALDEEADGEVQLEILKALGRLATPDAVQKLLKAAEPEGRLFRKKSIDYRVAAVRALAEARTAAALQTLQALVNDKEQKVREAVAQAMVDAVRRDERSS